MSSNLNLNGNYPSVQYQATESGGGYFEDREVDGVLVRARNAQFVTTPSAEWKIFSSAGGGAQAVAVKANGSLSFLSVPAGSANWTVWEGNGNNGEFNVQDFGAIGDGSTDCTTAIQNAINACSRAGGGKVVIPVGVVSAGVASAYVISSPLSVPSPMIIEGQGRYASVIQVKASSYAYFNSAGILQPGSPTVATDVVVRDLTVDGNRRNATSPSAKEVSGILTGTRWLIERVSIYDVNAWGINVSLAAYAATNDVTIVECEFDSAPSSPGAQGDGIGGGNDSVNTRIVRCRWNANYKSTTSLIDLTNALNVMIEDCVFEPTAVPPLDVIMEAVQGGHLRGCQFLNGTSINVQSDAKYSPSGGISMPRNFVIDGNYLNGAGVQQAAYACIRVAFNVAPITLNPTIRSIGSNIVIVNNTLDTPYWCGILWESDGAISEGVNTSDGGHIISNNAVVNANYKATPTINTGLAVISPSAINCEGSVGIVISNNNLHDDRKPARQQYALQIGRLNGPVEMTTTMVVHSNNMMGAVTGNPVYNNQNTSSIPTVRSNQGYNPVGKFSNQPANPSGTSPYSYSNITGFDSTVYVSATSTVTAVKVGGQTIPGLAIAAGATSSAIRVPAGQQIELLYLSTAPTWTWFGD